MTSVLKAKLTRAINAAKKLSSEVADKDGLITNLAAQTSEVDKLQAAELNIVNVIRQYDNILEKFKAIEGEWMVFIATLPKIERDEIEEIFLTLIESSEGLLDRRDEIDTCRSIMEENLFAVKRAIRKLESASNADSSANLRATSQSAITDNIAAADPHATPQVAPTAIIAAAHPDTFVGSGHAPQLAQSGTFSGNRSGYHIKLPQIQLGSFSGNPREWPRFWNAFEACVDKAPAPDIVKLNYLLSCLRDSAAEAVKKFDICTDNYALVKSTLLERFGSDDKIIEQLYKDLQSLRAPGESRSEARKFVDDLEAILHQMDRRQINTSDVPIMMAIEKLLPKWMKTYIFTMKMTDNQWTVTKLRSALKTIIQLALEDKDRYEDKTFTTTMPAVEPAKPPKKEAHQSTNPKWDKGNSTQDRGEGRCVLCNKHARSAECRTYDTFDKRKERIKELRLCFKCNTAGHRSSNCKKKIDKCKCGKLHNPVLCFPKKDNGKSTSLAVTNPEDEGIQHIVAHVAGPKEVALMTVEVLLENPHNGHKVKTLAFFDSGSQLSFITNELARAMGLPHQPNENMEVKTFNGPAKQIQYCCQTVHLIETNGTKKTLAVKSVDSIVQAIRSIRVKPQSADEKKLNHHSIVSETRTPHIIIGNDYYWSIVNSKIDQLDNGFEVISSSVGKMLAGMRSADTREENVCAVLTPVVTPAVTDNQIDELIKESFELDIIGIKDSPEEKDDEVAWELFENSVKFEDGRYVCSLPWKDAEPKLPTNEGLAFRQLQACKTRFAKRPDLAEALQQIIEEWTEKAVIELVPPEEKEFPQGLTHYLPYHIVETPNKTTTKKRLVHNASAKTKGQPSLNELLYRGPVMLPDLAGMILRFREYNEVVIGDLEKAFLQLTLNQKDRDVLRFLYPKDWKKPFDKENVEVYRFKRVNFGVICSPFLLAGAIRTHLKKYDTPLDREMLANTYVDNVLLEAADSEEAGQKASKAHARFNEANMNLREFVSSNAEFNQQWCAEVPQAVSFLGLKWLPSTDRVQLTFPEMMFDNPTKRQILKKTAAIFDPMGLVAPAVLPFRLVIQDLWKRNKGWDEHLDEEDNKALYAICNRETGTNIYRPRKVIHNAHRQELHIFVDASKKAFAACAYLKDVDEPSSPQLIFSKIRLAPIKEATIPRLELLALVIGTKMTTFLKKHTSATIVSTTIWSDSQCVLAWIKTKKDTNPRFVANCLKKIEGIDANFNYVGTKCNPADIASRGCSSEELKDSSLWWNGPSWLAMSKEQWPEQPSELFNLQNREVYFEPVTVSVVSEEHLEPDPNARTIDPARFSSWTKMVNTAMNVILFGRLLRRKSNMGPDHSIQDNETHLSHTAERVVLREIQARHPPSLDQIRQLRLYRDKDTLWRSQGRIENSSVAFSQKDPIFLSKKDWATKLLVLDYHTRHQHSSATHTLAQIRTAFWIPRARNFVRQTLKESCMKCRRDLARPYKAPEMPPLPSFRVTRAQPFERTGVDYAGPFNVRQDTSLIKVWICLFTCLVTRVIHLEVVTDLSSASFLTSLRRFVARRGRPNFMLSDNGTNFKGAFQTVTEGWTEKCEEDLFTYCSTERMEWKFIPSLSPWFGGVYERMIGIMKRSLGRAVGNRLLSYDHFWTLVTETEAIVNSRPLVYVDEEERTLRPIDFLMPNATIGVPCSSDDYEEVYCEQHTTREQLTSQWRRSRKILEQLWNSWYTEYLSSLRERYNFQLKQGRSTARTTPEVGEVVILAEENRKRGQWKLATIDSVSESQEGAVRSVYVRTGNGRMLHRSVAQVYPLEIRPPVESSTKAITSESPVDSPTLHEVVDTNPPSASEETGYNLRPRQKKPSYVFYMLAILAIFGTTTADNCVKDVHTRLVYQQECVSSGMLIFQSNASSYCWKRVNCKDQHIQRMEANNLGKRICGPRCACPKGSDGCSFHIDPHNVSKEDLTNRLNSIRPHVCSFVRSRECPTAVFKQIHQIQLGDGTRQYVSQLNIVRRQTNGDEAPMCFGSGEITGTPEYCAQNPCSKTGTQYCVLTHHEYADLVTPLGTVPIVAWFTENRTIFDHPPMEIEHQSEPCAAANLSCSNKGIDIQLGHCFPDVLEVCATDSTPHKCNFFDYVSPEVTVSLPPTRLVSDYNVLVKLWDRGSIQHTATISCTRQDVCNVSDCIFCWSLYFHPHCLLDHIGQATLRVLLAVAAFLSFIFLLWRVCKSRIPSRQHLFRRRPWRPTRLTERIPLLLATLCIIPPSSACNSIISFQANESSCTSNQHGQLYCTYDQVTSVTMHTGSEACIMLKDGLNRPMGTLHLTATHWMKCQKKNIFYTTPVEIHTVSSKRCPGMGSCTGTTCSLLKEESHVPELAEYEIFPGSNHCEESCSCFTCGCLSCAAACMYYRIYASPISPEEVYFSYQCEWTKEVEVIASLHLDTGIRQQHFRIPPGGTSKGETLTISVQAVGRIHEFDANKRFIKSKKTTAILSEFGKKAAEVFKCKSEKMETRSCLLERNACSCHQADSVVSCSCSENKLISKELKDNALPQFTEGMVIENHNDELQTSTEATVNLVIKAEGLIGQTKVELSICTMKEVRLQGCFACEQGARIGYICQTDFGRQQAHVQCESFEFPAICDSTSELRFIMTTITKSIVSENCKITCPGAVTPFKVQGELVYTPPGELWKISERRTINISLFGRIQKVIQDFINKLMFDAIPLVFISIASLVIFLKLLKLVIKKLILVLF